MAVVDTDPLAGFPSGGFVREATILKVIPVHRSTLWRWVKQGTFPQPEKLGANVTVWLASEVRAHLLGILAASAQVSSRKTKNSSNRSADRNAHGEDPERQE